MEDVGQRCKKNDMYQGVKLEDGNRCINNYSAVTLKLSTKT